MKPKLYECRPLYSNEQLLEIMDTNPKKIWIVADDYGVDEEWFIDLLQADPDAVNGDANISVADVYPDFYVPVLAKEVK